MADQKKTKAQLIEELQQLRARLSDEELAANGPYLAIFESTTEGILFADISTQCFVEANPAICRMLGYTREQLVGMSVKDIHPSESLNLVLDDFVAQARGQKAVARELPCLKSDGSVFYADIRVGKAVMHGRPCTVGFFSDVTERRRAYDLARLQCNLAIDLNSATNLNAALCQCLDTAVVASGMDSGGIYLVDTATGGLELQCHTGLSDRFINVCAHYDADSPNTRLAMSGTPMYVTHDELIRILKLDKCPEALRALAVIPVLHTGRVIACLNIASHTVDDIAPDARRVLEGVAAAIGSTVSRLRAEQALASTEARYHEVFGTIQEGIGIVDDNETILLANPAYARIFDEESVDAIIGKSLFEYLPDDQREIVLKQTEQRREGEFSEYELDIVTKKGNRKTLFVSVTPRFNSEGRYTGAVGAVLDITERKRADEALREHRALLKSIADGTTDAIYVKDLEGRYKFFNAAAESVVGKSAEEVLGKDDYAIFPPSEAAIVMEGDRKVIEGQSTKTYEEVVTDATGRTVTYLSTKGPVFDSSRQIIGLFGIARDITERKRIEVALRESEALLSAQFTNSPNIILIVNRDHKVVIINKGLAGRFTAAELKGMDCIEILPPETRDETRRRLAECFNSGEMQEFEHRISNDRWVRACLVRIGDGGESDQVMIISSDITERRRAEEGLRESEAFNRAVIDNSPIGISIRDAKARLLSVNKAWMKIWDVSQQDVDQYIEESATEFIGAANRTQLGPWLPQVESIYRQGGTLHIPELYYAIDPPARPRWVSFTYYSLMNDRGEVNRVVILTEDITERKLAEEALRESEGRFRELADLLPQTVYELDASGRFTYSNEFGFASTGYTQDDIDAGLNALELVVPSERERCAAAMQQVLGGVRRGADEYTMRRKDGSEFPAIIYSAPILCDGRVVGIRGIVADITGRKQAELALRESEARWQFALEGAGDGVWDWNALTNQVTYSRQWKSMLGYEEYEIGDTLDEWDKRVHPDDKQAVHEEIQKHFNGESPNYISEHRVRCKDGGYKWILDRGKVIERTTDGKPKRVIGTHADITERKQVEAALRESEERLKDITFSMADWVWEVNEKGVYTYSSHHVSDILGRSAEEIVGKTPFDFMPPDEAKRVVEIFSGIVARKAPIEDLENWNIRKNGDRICLLTNGVPVLDEEGNLKGYRGVDKDITERKRVEEELRRLSARHETLLASVPDIIMEVDSDKVYTWANRAGYDFFGDDVIGKEAADYFEGEQETYNAVQPVFAGDEDIIYVESWQRRRDGEKRLLAWWCKVRKDAEGRVLGALSTARDITERKQAEEALRATEEKYRTLVNNVPIAVYRSTPSGKVLSANPALVRILGYDSEEDYCSRPAWNSYVDPNRRKEFIDELRKHGSVTDFESQMFRKDGTVIWVSANATVHKNENEEIEYIDGTEEDITELKHAREALAESEERYRQIVEASPFGMHMYQLEPNGRLVFEGANPAADWILRIDHSRLKGKTIEEAFPDLIETEVPEQYRLIARHGERWRTENISYQDGRIKGAFEVVAFQRSPMKMAAVFKDITDRKRAEESLRIAEEQYRLLFEGADEGILVVQHGKIVLSNPALTAISGYSSEEFTQRPFTDFIHPEDRELVRDRYQRRVAGEDVPVGYDFRIITNTGGIKTMRINASIITWRGMPATLSFLADVTARRQAEEELRKFKTISDNASYGTQIINPDATFLYVNRAFAEMHGYSPDELIGRHVSLCHTEEQMTIVSAGIREVFRSGAFVSQEVWHLHRNGTEFPTLMSGSVINDASGQPQYMATTTVDITELKRLQESADRAHRLEAAGRIAGQVAHDFNNLLGPLVAYPGIIREELGDGHPVSAYLEPIEAAAQQMAEINQQLLTLGRRGHYVLEPLNLNEVIRQTLEQVQPQVMNLAVVTDLATDLMNINGAVAQMARVMTNLINNSLDAMQGVGTLTITSENWYADEAQGKYGQIARGEYAKVTISDTGCGIPEDIMPHVFEPFFTTKKTDRKRGSGLGLSVVHTVVEDHEGYIEIDSVVGQGTSIQLYFPITREEILSGDETIVCGNGQSVLVVDDDATQREVTFRLLQKLGYRAETVDCGEVALERLQSRSYDLLILDMIMPGGLDGADTYKRAKELHPEQQAIIVSGYAESGRVSEAQRMGAGDFVRKPLTLKSLAVAVRRELDRKLVSETIC